jgi:hypothetical protein
MCFSIEWLAHMLVGLVFICAAVGILCILIPWILSLAGIGVDARIRQVLTIIVGAVIIIALIWFCVDLYECMGGGARLR